MNKISLQIASLLILICGSWSCGDKQKSIADDQPRRIEILFLGHDSEHHNSAQYLPILASALTRSGINLTYTESVDDLNPKTLGRYDGLLLYANHEEITPGQEKALLEYVDEGHAFIPVHSASFCFQNSPEFIDLVGAQFKEHKTDSFTVDIINKEHPITTDLNEFETWDETYVHDKFADDIQILMERVEGDHHEPWTWVKSYGDGKVFYTAYGHDEKTWKNPGFHELMKQGILWAVNETALKNWQEYIKDIPDLTYEEVEGIPNYEKRDPAPKYQLPLTPQESKKLIQVPAGFDLQLFASEPDIVNPIAMNWDEQGRLWVIETVDYPNTVREEEGIGDDRIKICEDTDGDGKADKFTIFADKLNIPTSFTFANGGIIVSQAPVFLFLKDTDGDDVADVRESVIEGWGTFDTHAGPSNLQYGMDNQIYGVVGYSGFEGNIFGSPYQFGQGIYRFNTGLNHFEFLTNTSNNTWGLGYTESNAIFASTANNTHSVFMAIPNRTLAGIEGISTNGSKKIDGHYNMLAITPNVRQVDVFGGFTAAAGHHFYTARAYPEWYWNHIAFVCEPTGGVVHQALIEKEGSGYYEKDGGNLFASSDEWVSPVEAKVGPDGAVWVLDWYNFIIQHNPTPTVDRGGFDGENGEGNAYRNPLRDKERGRIWRVFPRQIKSPEITSLDKENPSQLVKALSNDNLFWRMTAQRLLVEHKHKDILSSLYDLIRNKATDELGLAPGALHALWTIDGLAVLPENDEALSVIKQSLSHPAPSVRRAAIQILNQGNWSDQELIESMVLDDPDPEVLLAALIEVADRPSNEELGKKVFQISEKESILNDPWLSNAVYAAGVKHRAGFIAAFTNVNPDFTVKEPEIIHRETMSLDDSQWKEIDLPQYNEAAGIDMNGLIWYRKEIELTASEAGKAARISLGPVNDSDITYFNGKQIGKTERDYEKERIYTIPGNMLKNGKNIIAIQLEDIRGWGGVYGKPEQMYLEIGGKKISLAGSWKYEIEKNTDLSNVNVFEGTTIAKLLAKTYLNRANEEIDGNDLSLDGNVKKVLIKTIPNQMKFDVTEIQVTAGQTVQITLENTDFMQHNLVITEPEKKEIVGEAADELALEPNGSELNYVPQIPEVLFATELVDPQEKVVLTFKAPSEPGVYPFICTFPGHWRIMQGTMTVTPESI